MVTWCDAILSRKIIATANRYMYLHALYLYIYISITKHACAYDTDIFIRLYTYMYTM